MSYFFHAATLSALAFVIFQTTLIGRSLMATQAQVDALTAQVVKVRGEIQVIKTEVVNLKDQLANAETVEQIDLSALESAVQAADDENVDVVPVVAPEVEGEPDDEDEDEDEDVATEPVAVDEPVIEDAAPVE
jgi:hypothetical protein